MVVASGPPIPMGSVPRSPKSAPSTGSSDRPSLHRRERSSPVKNRTPHLFANAFFVHLPRFFPISLDCNVMSLVDARSRVWAVRPRPCKGWLSPPPSAAVGLDRACRPAFAAANHFDGGPRQRLAQLITVTLRITQLLSLPPRMKGRTEFLFPAWCRPRRATGRRPNEGRGRGRGLALSEPRI